MLSLFSRFDFLTIGVATAGSVLLGFVVYYNNKNSITNRLFLVFSIINVFWGISNYLASYVGSAFASLLVARLVMFFAVWQAYSFFLLLYVFPDGSLNYKKSNFILLLIFTSAISVLALSPLVFTRVTSYVYGLSPQVEKGPGIMVFGLFCVSLISLGLYSFVRKIIRTSKENRKPFVLISVGMALTFTLIVLLNFILPSIFNNYTFVTFGALFTLPFLVLTGYAVARHKILNVKVFSTAFFAFLILAISFVQVVTSTNYLEFFIQLIVFILLIIFSILIIKSVVAEVDQKEKVLQLAHTLEQANIQLKELDRQKTDFLSIAAHQLRTPLSIVKGYLELLMEDAYGKLNGETKQVLRNMDESNGRLSDLVDNFLDITRLEQGRVKYDFVERNLNDTISSVVKELSNRADQKGLYLSWEPDSNLQKAYFDEEKIRHVIFNYIDNAIKYTDVGNIYVTASVEGDGIGVRVKDNGIGFDKVDEASFFQKFYRGNNVRGINVNGTGLGLFVCSKFVQAHHGKVWAHSEGPGKGSEFGFWIPVAVK